MPEQLLIGCFYWTGSCHGATEGNFVSFRNSLKADDGHLS